MRGLWFVAVAALICGIWALLTIGRLDDRLRSNIASDMVVVPTRMYLTGSTAGMAPSSNGNEISFWLSRLDSNAQTRISLDKNGTQSIEFFDKRGKLRLKIGIDENGEGEIRFVDSKGVARIVQPATAIGASTQQVSLRTGK